MRQDKRSYSALASNSPNSTLIHKLSTAQALNDRGARQSNSTNSNSNSNDYAICFVPARAAGEGASGLPAFRRKKRGEKSPLCRGL